MRLWTAHLPCLKGFYASDAYAVAETRVQAAHLVLAAVSALLDKNAKEWGFFSPIDVYPDDPDWDDEVTAFLGKVHLEAQEWLEPVPGGAIINIKN